jgi:hypothetical protein
MSKCYDNPEYDDLGNGLQNTWEHQYRYEQKQETKVMKNIHITPTDKETRLYLSNYGKELNLASHPKTLYTTGQHIYITSDEEIKEGDWCLDKFNQRWKLKDKKLIAFDSQGIKKFSTDNILGHECKKIILTTDQDLINDGVQSIDDEFLEWFLKNPNCEWVEIEKYCRNGLCEEEPGEECWYNGCQCPGERLIIPKKNFYCGDEVDYGDKCSEQCDGCVNSTGVDYGYLPKKHVEFINDNIDEFDEKIKEFKQIDQNNPVTRGSTALVYKQETLEDIKLEEVVGSNHCRYSVIENKLSTLYRNQEQILKAIKMLNNGQQRSYNEEETKQLSFDFYYDMSRKMNVPENLITENMTNLDVWFEQYKKK